MRSSELARAPPFVRFDKIVHDAPVAQLDRVLPSEGRGRGFESRRARQNFCIKLKTYGLLARF
jgi:hypothetical protein